MTTAIKFCGITRAEDARVANELGAAYVGCIFADSPRRVRPTVAAAIWSVARDSRKVGVFGDSSVDEILAAAAAVDLDVIQLHASSDAATVEQLRASFPGEIWSVVRVGGDGDAAQAITAAAGDAVLVDTHSDARLGGTGRAFDWVRETQAIREAKGNRRLIVAGGLTPENVGAAIHALRPDVVDVSSGVELSPGVKDPERMLAFAAAVKDANGQ